MLVLVFEKLAVAVVPGVALGAPYEARLAKDLDPCLGEAAVLPLASETVLPPLVVDPLPEGLVLRVVPGDQAVLVLVLVFEKLAVAVVPGSQLILPHFGFPHFEKKRKRGVVHRLQLALHLGQPRPDGLYLPEQRLQLGALGVPGGLQAGEAERHPLDPVPVGEGGGRRAACPRSLAHGKLE